jgi:K+/H+ antiporter YhaU regulatory subunit KhtT
MSSLDPGFLTIAKYVNCGADLVEQLIKDIKAGQRISGATIIALSRFQDAAIAAEKLLDPVVQNSVKLNN